MSSSTPARRHVVVVGAGVLGLACAARLSEDETLSVTVIDRQHPASGSSGLSVGVFTMQYTDPFDVRLRLHSVGRLRELEAAGRLDVHHIGMARLARDDATLADYRASAELQRELGVTDTAVLDAEGVRRLLPDYDAEGVVGALWSPSEGYIDGARLAGTLAEEAQERGATLRVRTALEGLRRTPERPARYAVQTSAGALPADVVVNAAGPWAAQVGELLEAPVAVLNERHEAHLLELPAGFETTVPMMFDYVLGQAEEGLYFRQEGAGQLIAGLHSNDLTHDAVADPDDYFRGVTETGTETIVRRLALALPELELRYRGGWAGLYPHHPAGRFVLGPHPDNPDMIVGAGLGGIGVSTSPILGEILADWVRFGEPRCFPAATALLPPS